MVRTELTKDNLVDYLSITGSYGSLECTQVGSIITIKFTKLRPTTSFTFFSDGTICDADSNTYSSGAKLKLTFTANAIQTDYNAETGIYTYEPGFKETWITE